MWVFVHLFSDPVAGNGALVRTLTISSFGGKVLHIPVSAYGWCPHFFVPEDTNNIPDNLH